jgi:hypothetical protein
LVGVLAEITHHGLSADGEFACDASLRPSCGEQWLNRRSTGPIGTRFHGEVFGRLLVSSQARMVEANKVFELWQTLRKLLVTAEYATKRRILRSVFLNCRLDDATLCPVIRKPFDVLIKGLLL